MLFSFLLPFSVPTEKGPGDEVFSLRFANNILQGRCPSRRRDRVARRERLSPDDQIITGRYNSHAAIHLTPTPFAAKGIP